MTGKARRVALYVRVSTDHQSVENQIRELKQVAERRGWQVVGTYQDAGIKWLQGSRPFSRLSMTTRALTSDGQRRRRPTPVITSTRSTVPGLVSKVRSTLWSNRCRPMEQNHWLRSLLPAMWGRAIAYDQHACAGNAIEDDT